MNIEDLKIKLEKRATGYTKLERTILLAGAILANTDLLLEIPNKELNNFYEKGQFISK